MRFAVFADVHLDTVFRWANPQLARRRRQDVREALSRIIDRAVEAEVDAILCAGDLYEHEYVTADTARFIQATFERAKPIRVFIAPGNHDWFGPQSLYARLEWSSNVHIFRDATLSPVELRDGFTLWGAAHRAPANTDGFLSSFRVDRSGVNVALFHGSERGTLLIQEEGKQPHAPFDEQEVERAGLSHVFVGHFHKPRDAARHTYPGNPEPLAFGEEARSGLVIAEIDSSGILERRRIDVHTMTMLVLDMDISDCTNSFDVREMARELLRDSQGIVRLVLRGEIQPDLDLRLEDLSDLTRDGLTVLPLAEGLTVAYDIERIAAEKTVRGEFVRQIMRSQMTEDQRRRVIITGLRAFAGRDDLEVI